MNRFKLQELAYLLSFLISSTCGASTLVWSTPETIPANAANVIFPAYDAGINKFVTTWVDSALTHQTYSSVFDGENWSSPQMLPNPAGFAALLFSAYDPSLKKLVAVWADDSSEGRSSTFNGSSWSDSQIIPGSAGGALFFPISTARGKLATVWGDSMGNGFSSFFDGENWSPSPQEFPVNTSTFILFPGYNPASNTLIAAWVVAMGPDVQKGFASVFNGTNWNPPQFIADNIAFPNILSVYNPKTEQLMLFWSDATSHQGFYSNFDGENWSLPQEVPGTNIGSAFFPVFNQALGQVVVSWTDFSTLEGHFSLFDGINWSTPEAFPGSNTANVLSAYDPVLGKVVAVWTDFLTNQGYFSLSSLPPLSFRGSGNLSKIANYINAVGQSVPLQPILALLNKLSPNQLKAALASISNARNSFFPWTAGSCALSLSQRMETHAAELRWLAKNSLSSHNSNLTSLITAKELPQGSAQTAAREEKSCSLWVEGLENFSHQKAQDQNPSFDARIGDVLLGSDYYGKNLHLVGSVAYARAHLKEGNNAGHGTIDSYATSLYATGSIERGYLEVGLLGAYNHYASNRHISFPGFNAHAKASFSGWQALPHLGFGYNLPLKDWILEPFASADCAIIIQNKFSEHGAAPLNMKQHRTTSELFQAKGGLRAYLSRSPAWGVWLFQITAAYLYVKGWNVGKISNASIVGQPSGFTVTSLNNARNCFASGVEFFVRANQGTFASLAYQGEFASKFNTNSITAKLGLFF